MVLRREEGCRLLCDVHGRAGSAMRSPTPRPAIHHCAFANDRYCHAFAMACATLTTSLLLTRRSTTSVPSRCSRSSRLSLQRRYHIPYTEGAMCMSSEISDAVSSLSDVRYSDRAGDLTMRCPAMPLPGVGGAFSFYESPDKKQVTRPICLRACYAVSGTGIAYGAVSVRASSAMRYPVLAYCMVLSAYGLCDARYWPRL
eukprot:3249442-Rhodomonas_salina.2